MTAPRAIVRARVLVVEDGDALRRGIARALREGFAEVDEEASGERAIERLSDRTGEPYDVVVTDLRLPGADGIEVLRAARDRDERTSVVLMTAFGSVETAVEAMRLGAFDFVQKPFDLEQLEARVTKAAAHGRLLREVTSLRAERVARFAPDRVIGASPALRTAVELARRVAPTRSTVLVTGETGTGKEVIAGLVHGFSRRAEAPFVKVNCAALPETLLESELFGHERGAFTGADRARIGRFEQANGGTLFLDEIGDMPLSLQAKLLRFLQDRVVERIGGRERYPVDVRVVCATNKDLPNLIKGGGFREDLYYRISEVTVRIPPLRDRSGDAVVIAQAILERRAQEHNRQIKGFTPEALKAIEAYPWPGNIRELENRVNGAVIMSEGKYVGVEDLGLPGDGTTDLSWLNLRVARQRGEREAIRQALAIAGSNLSRAADLLGITRPTLYDLMEKNGIAAPEKAAEG